MRKLFFILLLGLLFSHAVFAVYVTSWNGSSCDLSNGGSGGVCGYGSGNTTGRYCCTGHCPDTWLGANTSGSCYALINTGSCSSTTNAK